MSQSKRNYIVTVSYTIQATGKDAAERCAKAFTEESGASLSTPAYTWQADTGKVKAVDPA